MSFQFLKRELNHESNRNYSFLSESLPPYMDGTCLRLCA